MIIKRIIEIGKRFQPFFKKVSVGVLLILTVGLTIFGVIGLYLATVISMIHHFRPQLNVDAVISYAIGFGIVGPCVLVVAGMLCWMVGDIYFDHQKQKAKLKVQKLESENSIMGRYARDKSR